MPGDHAATLPDQYRTRRQLAWSEVRSLGRALAFESRAFRETANVDHYHEWKRLRHHLAFALRSWANYRDWEQQSHPAVRHHPTGDNRQ